MTGQKQYPKTYRFNPNPAGKPYQPDPANKERDLETARRIQRKLLFPKFCFLTGFLPLLIAMGYEKLTGEPVEGFIIFGFCYVFTVWPLAIGLTLLFGSCPYCHKTQGLNGRVYTLTGREISTSRGVSPFITKCIRCGAPLSVKEVEAAYHRLEEQEKAT
ncbi:hypothetical protein [Eikenella corrodens]|uniref:hypothetical protein n=1 Tax=Eikenella corrodens TaxID=539 RepID=UPI00129A19EB|nr:hypothetical protein [Eikenella corrodens]